MNFDNYKFRCHALPNLMVKSRSKSDPLSETTKAYLRELWIKEVYGREKYDSKNKFTDKGIACESDSLDLFEKVTGDTHFKNKKEFSNEFVTGTPDIKTPLIDIKTSWDIFTFANADESYAKKAYYYQLLGYMWLTDAKEGEIAFCLVNTPDEIMQSELYKLSFRFPEINESEEKAEKYKRNYIFDDIDPKNRVKRFKFERNDFEIAELTEKIVLSRNYLNDLSL